MIGIDLSRSYLARAQALAAALGHEDRVTYFQGDFMELTDQTEPADVTILDKVVHCSHDPERLIKLSAARTRDLYALTFLRNRREVRLMMRVLGPFLPLFLPFRVRFSHPEAIRAWVREAGFERLSHDESDMWHMEVYARHEETQHDGKQATSRRAVPYGSPH